MGRELPTGTSGWRRRAVAVAASALALFAIAGLIERAREEDARIAVVRAWLPLRQCLLRVADGTLRCDGMGELHGEWARHACVGCAVAASALRVALENPEMRPRPPRSALAALARVHAAFVADTLPPRDDVETLLQVGSEPAP